MTIKIIMKSGAAAIVFAGILSSSARGGTCKGRPRLYQMPNPPPLFVLSIGRGEQVNLPVGVADVVVANPTVADVDVRSPKQLYILAKRAPAKRRYMQPMLQDGQSIRPLFALATTSTQSIRCCLLAMPESDIKVTTMNGVVLLTGTVAQPEDVQEAESTRSGFCRHAKPRSSAASRPRCLCR
jgi:pilus assembly protein CpaC